MNNTLVAGQQFQYRFDNIGNRTLTAVGGNASGLGLRQACYGVDSLNQLTNREVPGTNDVVGAGLAFTNVLVNSVAADRMQDYFHGLASAVNTNSAQWLGVSVTGAGQNVTGNLYLPRTPERFQYDPDGNLLQDGRWAYTWDGENRLLSMTVSNGGVGPQYQLNFTYDAQGRRIQKVVAVNGVPSATNNFLYDGWNLIAVLGPQDSLQATFTWGTDLSGSWQEAGGVGGLLEASFYNGTTTNAFVAYDGNGNVAELVNAADGSVAADYEYGPLGEIIRADGPLSVANPFRIATKYQDDESAFLYYGYRYYNPSTGKWINRDPSGENGGANLYGFVGNDAIDSFDRDGDAIYSVIGGWGDGNWGWVNGPNPYMTSDTTAGQVGSLFYNILPLAANSGQQLLDGIGAATDAVGDVFHDATLLATGDRQLAENSRNLTMLMPVGGEVGAVAKVEKTVQAASDVSRVSKVSGPAQYAAEKELQTFDSVVSSKAKASAKPVTEAAEETPLLGGAYQDVRAANVGGEVHHIPANSVSTLSHDQGPSIWMETGDHAQTASHGSQGLAGAEYRAQQSVLIDQGKFSEALQMDIRDIRLKFGSKYDVGIQQMLDYYKTIPGWKLELQ